MPSALSDFFVLHRLFGWEALSIASAVAQGILSGTKNAVTSVVNIVRHPIETIQNLGHGISMLGVLVGQTYAHLIRCELALERGDDNDVRAQVQQTVAITNAIIAHCSHDRNLIMNTITIFYSKRFTYIMLALSVIIIPLLIAALYYIDFNEINWGTRLFYGGYSRGICIPLNPSMTRFVFKWSLYAILGMSIAVLFIIIKRLRSGKPALIISPDGLWVDLYGHIRWDNVDNIFETTISGQSLVTIAVKDVSSLKKQASLRGRINLLIYRNALYIAHLEYDNKTVIKQLRDYHEAYVLNG